MRTLVIDTATQALSLTLFDGDRVVHHHHEIAGRGHAERLVPLIATLPDRGKADHIAVDLGPGSFTGVRIGLAAAKALALAWKVPISGYSSLSAVAVAAQAARPALSRLPIVLTGGHGELFWQVFDGKTLVPITGIASTPIAALAAILADGTLFGSGAETLTIARGGGEAVLLHPDSLCYISLPQTLKDIPASPLYGRGADAKPMAESAPR